MLSIERLDNLIRRAPVLMMIGFGLVVMCQFVACGAVIALHLIGLGAVMGSVESYKHERGIWMLALLFGGLFLAIAVLIEFCLLRDAIRGAPQSHWSVVVECAIALHLQWLLVRTMLSAAVYNRRLTR